MSHEYEDYVKPVSADALAQLSTLADRQVSAQQAVKQAERQVEIEKANLREIAEVQIPELMQKLGMEKFTTTSGLTVSVQQKVRASVLAAKKAEAMKWLRDNGHEALIKRIVKVQFGMGEDAKAAEAIAALGDLPVEDDSSVHAQTLAKFVRELDDEGKTVPEELFSVHRQRVSQVKI